MVETHSEYDFWNDRVAQTTPRIKQQLRGMLLQGYRFFFQATDNLNDLTRKDSEREEVSEVGGIPFVNFSADDKRLNPCIDYFIPGGIYQIGVFDIADFRQANRRFREAAVVVRSAEEIGEERIFKLNFSEYIIEGAEQQTKRKRPTIEMEVKRPQVIVFKNGSRAEFSDSEDGEPTGGELGYLVLLNCVVRIFSEDRAKPYGIAADLIPIEVATN